jgi:hypothetical protein
MKISATTGKYVFLPLLAGIFIWRCAVQFHPPEPPEPEYQGKKLTDWAKEIDRMDFFRQPKFQQHKAQSELALVAIRRIGTNALPVALRLCAAQDFWFKRKYTAWIQEHGDEAWAVKPPFKINFIPADEQRFEGINIIWALGPAAKPAIPRLIQLFQSSDPEISEDMMDALPGAGTNVVPPLIGLLHSPDKDVRTRAAILLGRYFGPQAQAAIPVLLECLDDPKLNLVSRVRVIHTLDLVRTPNPPMKQFENPTSSNSPIKRIRHQPNGQTNSTPPASVEKKNDLSLAAP